MVSENVSNKTAIGRTAMAVYYDNAIKLLTRKDVRCVSTRTLARLSPVKHLSLNVQ